MEANLPMKKDPPVKTGKISTGGKTFLRGKIGKIVTLYSLWENREVADCSRP
jgi:hypothetical protein